MHKKTNKLTTLKFIVLITGLLSTMVMFWVFDLHQWINISTVEDAIKQTGILGPVMYVLLFAIAVVLILPASIPTLMGATLFEPITAYISILIGAMLGASLSFLLGRALGRQFVIQQLAGEQSKWGLQIQKIDKKLTTHGFLAMLYIRLGPLPFAIPSYGASLSGMRFKDFFMGTFLGSLPHIFVFVFLGDTLKRLLSQGFIETITAWQTWCAGACFLVVFLLPSVVKLMVPGTIDLDVDTNNN